MKAKLLTGAITSLLFSPTLSALELDAVGEAAEIRTGDSGVVPKVSIAFGSDDNVAEEQSGDERSDEYWRIRPELNYLATKRRNYLQFGIKGDLTRYSELSEYDTDKALIGLKGHIEPSSKLRVTSQALLERNSLELSDNVLNSNAIRNNVTLSEPVVYDETRLNINGSYGARSARGVLGASIRAASRQYDSHPQSNQLNVFDRDRIGLGLRFGFRVAPRIRTNLRYEYDDYEFDRGNTIVEENSYTEQQVLAGIEFVEGAFWNGGIDVGARSVDYQSDSQEDIEDVQWNADLTWSPLTYSTLTLLGGREIGDSGDFTTDSVRLTWRHAWAERLNSQVYGEVIEDDFDTSNRSLSTSTIGGRLSYQFRRWLSWEFAVKSTSRSASGSATAADEYDRVTAEIGVTGSL